jgi:hypothetical protein
MATFRSVTLRVTEEEAKLIEAGAEALGVSKSTLIATSAQIAAHQLGFFEDGRTVQPQPGSWKDAPLREKGSLVEQIVISLNPLEYQTVRQAAQWSFVSFPVFLIGATLRFLATCRETQPKNAKLAALELPPPYEEAKRARVR